MKILNKLKYIKYRFSKKYCFDEMCNAGNVTKNKKCGGVYGGDKLTNYLNYSCIDCKYFDDEIISRWNRLEASYKQVKDGGKEGKEKC